MNICIFGDSIVYGAADEKMGGWVNRITLSLINDKKFDGHIYNLGVSGHIVDDVLTRLEKEAAARKTDAIIIGIGTNDSQFLITENQNRTPIEKFEKNIFDLIKTAKKITNNIIFVGLIPVNEEEVCPIPWNTNKIYKNQYIEQYSDVIKGICEKEKLNFIDLYSEMIKIDYKKLLFDGLHPNSEGHKWMAEKIIREISL